MLICFFYTICENCNSGRILDKFDIIPPTFGNDLGGVLNR